MEFENTTHTTWNQSKTNCSKLFKLKTNGDTVRLTGLYNHNRKSKDCDKVRQQVLQTEESNWNPARARRYTSYKDVECYLQWEISSVHYKRGFSGPGYLGEFVEALFMWYWGSLFSHSCYIILVYMKTCLKTWNIYYFNVYQMLKLMFDILQTFFLYAWIPHRKK